MVIGVTIAIGLGGSARAQTTQCVQSVQAQGTADQITSVPLQCALTTNLVILTPAFNNATTTPTFQPSGLPAQIITHQNGSPLAASDLTAGGKYLMTPTGSTWILLNPATAIAVLPAPSVSTLGGIFEASAGANQVMLGVDGTGAPIFGSALAGAVSGVLAAANMPSFSGDASTLAGSTTITVNAAPAGALTGTTLASNVVSSSLTSSALTSVGTIATGVWAGTTITVPHGGTGATTFSSNLPLIGAGTSAITHGTVSGNTTVFATSTGTLTPGDCVQVDASGNYVDAGGPCTTGGGGGTVSAGTAHNIAFYGSSGTTVTGLANGNSGVLVTSAAGVPSISTTLPTAFSIPNSNLANAATTVNGVTCTLGSTCSITATSTGVTSGTTTVSGATTGNLLYNNAGTLGDESVGVALATVAQIPPQGRLTLVSGTPVMTTVVTNAGTVYYTPYAGETEPLWNGSVFVPAQCAEISNVLANSASGSAGPYAAANFGVYDLYLWNNSGTCTLTRSDYWQQTATVTISIASPGVVTHTGHGLLAGQPVRFATSGALPTGLTAGTTYYVVAAATNTYEVAATQGGTAINTSGSQSGTQTATEGIGDTYYLASGFSSARGTANGQTAVDGVLTNTNSITNGPGAGYGTYVGTILVNGAGGVDFSLGGAASGGVQTGTGLWNEYNRVLGGFRNVDSGAPYTYSSSTPREARGSANNAIGYLVGEAEDGIGISYSSYGLFGTGTSTLETGLGINRSGTAISYTYGFCYNVGAGTNGQACTTTGVIPPVIGANEFFASENSPSVVAVTYDEGSNNQLLATMRY